MQPIQDVSPCLGYDARTWGHGTNRGSVEADVLQFRATVERAAEISGGRLARSAGASVE